MKLTKAQLKQIIKEELRKVLQEQKETGCREDYLRKNPQLEKNIAVAKKKDPARFSRWIAAAKKILALSPEEWAEEIRDGFMDSTGSPAEPPQLAEYKKAYWLLLQKYTGQTIGPDPCKGETPA